MVGGRYNVAGSFGALYLGFTPAVCEAEVTRGILAGLPVRAGSFVLWQYNVRLSHVVRLDQAETRNHIGVTEADLTIPGDRKWGSLIGEPLFRDGVEGLVAPSAQLTDGKCLDIYTDNLESSSHVNPTESRPYPTPTP